MVFEDELKLGEFWLLIVDKLMVFLFFVWCWILIILFDVVYFWIVLVFGVKFDVVLGCLRELSVKVEMFGVFWG